MGWYPMLHIAAKENFHIIEGYPSITKSEIGSFLHFVNYYKRKTQLDNDRINKIYANKGGTK